MISIPWIPYGLFWGERRNDVSPLKSSPLGCFSKGPHQSQTLRPSEDQRRTLLGSGFVRMPEAKGKLKVSPAGDGETWGVSPGENEKENDKTHKRYAA